jgi:hypothetical protein
LQSSLILLLLYVAVERSGFLYYGLDALSRLITASVVPIAVSTVLSRLMWGGWIALVVAFIIGAINFARRDIEKGQEYVAGAIKGAVAMAFYTAVITGLIGWQREDQFETSM